MLVTGAAGVLGAGVIGALAQRDIAFRGSSRRTKPAGFGGDWACMDLLSGQGIDAAVAGVSAIIHCASDPLKPESDLTALSNLIRFAATNKTHLVYVGIAGIDLAASAFGYYRIKLACEAMLRDSRTSYTIVRATQFFPFIDYIFQRLTLGPLLFVPAMTLRPVDIGFVANRLVDHALAADGGRAADVCGPEALDQRALAGAWMRARGLRKILVPASRVRPLTGLAKITAVHGDSGGATWAQWLAGVDRATAGYAG